MNPWRITFVAVATAIAAVGCAPISAPRTAFNPRAASYVLQEGENTIEGYALLRSAGGYVRTCRDEGVVLYPVTPYSREVVTLASGNAFGGFAKEPSYSALFDGTPLGAYSRHAQCDGEGRFRLEGVPDGQYYLVANIGWMVKSARFGGAVMKSVEISGGSTHSLVLEWLLPY